MVCPHLQELTKLPSPTLSNSVHREECTQCFDNQDSPDGVDVCLTCFNGGCATRHAKRHVAKTGHQWTLNVKRRPIHSPRQPTADGEPPAKMSKLAIVEEREEDKYTHATTLKCWQCDAATGAPIADPSIAQNLITAVMSAMSSARQSEVKAWEEEITPCEHTLTQTPYDGPHIAPSGLAKCNNCDLGENLWLCLTCGNLGCGRAQFGGIGGNGHGLSHFESSGHAVSVKLGTITPEGGADIYCYLCNDSKEDPNLSAHLAAFGINVQTLSKTEKTMTELQIEQNLKYDFSLTNEAGRALEPVFGPGLTGLANLGNSCYMASVLQTLFSLPAFQTRYFNTTDDHEAECTVSLPAQCVECQMRKIADGLLSGRYSHPAHGSPPTNTSEDDHLQHASPTPLFQTGIKPAGFKALIGKQHAEFATMKQQDAEEFFTYLMDQLRKDGKRFADTRGDPTTIFTYATEQRLQCTKCSRVRYRRDSSDILSLTVPGTPSGAPAEPGQPPSYAPVALTACIHDVLRAESLDWTCPACATPVQGVKQTRFASLPEVLVVQTKKYALVNWVPSKLAIPVDLPAGDVLTFAEDVFGRGLKVGEEEELPEENVAVPDAGPKFNEVVLGQLQEMGIPLIRAQRAMLATGGLDTDESLMWVLDHAEDADIDDPIPITGAKSGEVTYNPETLETLVSFGFTTAQVKKALRETNHSSERAAEWLFSHPDDMGEDEAAPDAAPSATKHTAASLPGSTQAPAQYRLLAFISHKGPSVHSGHYVAHIRRGEEWVLFNDEKVVKADEESVNELKKMAYLYFFVRV